MALHRNIAHLHDLDMELGATEAVQNHIARRVRHYKPISQCKLDFEARRPRWLRECMAEAVGVFFFCFPGIAATAALTVNNGNPAISSMFQIGCAYIAGITFAIITCAPTSGGHFNPAITLCFAFWQGFPWRKVPYFIASQIFGAFMAGLIMIGMYWQQLSEMKELFIAQGKPLIGPGSPASILCSFPNPDQTNLGYLFMIELFVDCFIGIIIWACLDPANPFVSPTTVPINIGLAYGSMAWAFGDVTIATNLARDLGTRIVAACLYGKEVFSYMDYSPIAILTNVPATLFATAFYEFLMRDSLTIIGKGHAVHEEGEVGLLRHISKPGVLEVEDLRYCSRQDAKERRSPSSVPQSLVIQPNDRLGVLPR